MICPNPNCGYEGPARRKARGSILVGLVLCLLPGILYFMFMRGYPLIGLVLCLLPGILYFIFMGGYRYSCPKCGLQIAADN